MTPEKNQPDVSTQTTAEIVSLNGQRQQLSQKVDQWNAGMVYSLLLTFLAAAAVLITTRMVVVRSKQLNGIQDRLEIANDRVAASNRLKLEHALSVQRERTAKAETTLLEVQQKIRWRDVTPEQATEFKSITGGAAKGVVTIQKLDQDPESVSYAQQIFGILKDAGWQPQFTLGKVIGGTEPGLSLSVYSQESLGDADSSLISPVSAVYYGQVLKNAFEHVGIKIDRYRVQSGPPIPRNSVFITIGQKP